MTAADAASSIPRGVELEAVPCPLGCAAGDREVVVGIDRLHGLPGEFRVVECTACGLMRTSPRPTEATIGYYYPADYAAFHTETMGDAGAVITLARSLLRGLQPRWLQNRRLPNRPPGRLLEIGCATGRFLHQMRQRGWQVSGIETSLHAVTVARAAGLDVYQGVVSTLPADAGPYDLIAGWMVLEHLHDPVGVLTELRSRVNDNGWLVLAVPDARGALGFELFRDDWYALQLPTHLFHYTPESVSAVLRAAGWAVDRIYWQHDAGNLFRSLEYRLCDGESSAFAKTCARIARHRVNPLAATLAIGLGTARCSGRMGIWARPR